jgi:hypothetical protein
VRVLVLGQCEGDEYRVEEAVLVNVNLCVAAHKAHTALEGAAGTQFTCFTGTKVQIPSIG